MAWLDVSMLACDGCWTGLPAWVGLFILVVCLIGTIWMLLWSNVGARLAYLITVISLASFMMILSALWMVGAPGTTTSTGPRGREVQWIPFLQNTEFAEDFQEAIGTFPDGEGWEPTGTVFAGKVDSAGEFETVRTVVARAFSNRAKVQDQSATKMEDWRFRDGSRPPSTPDEEDPERYTPATVAFNQAHSTKLLAGIQIPATDKHSAVTVFVFRDKGLVFLPALSFFLVSLIGFLLHVWLIARYEREQEAREEAMKPGAPAPEPVAG